MLCMKGSVAETVTRGKCTRFTWASEFGCHLSARAFWFFGPVRIVCELLFEVGARVGTGSLHDRLGRSRRDDAAAFIAALWPEIDDPVGGFDHVEVVLDDEDSVAAVDQTVQDVKQLVYIDGMEAGGRLIEDVERSPCTRCASPPDRVVAA